MIPLLSERRNLPWTVLLQKGMNLKPISFLMAMVNENSEMNKKMMSSVTVVIDAECPIVQPCQESPFTTLSQILVLPDSCFLVGPICATSNTHVSHFHLGKSQSFFLCWMRKDIGLKYLWKPIHTWYYKKLLKFKIRCGWVKMC